MPNHVATKTTWKKGHIPWWIKQGILHPMKNHVTVEKYSKTRKSRKIPAWNKGKILPKRTLGKLWNKGGYQYINLENGYRMYHRVVMEEYLGRELESYEIIHHIDGDKLNNKLENLYICNGHPEHIRIHQSMERFVYKGIREGKIKFDQKTKEFIYVSV